MADDLDAVIANAKKSGNADDLMVLQALRDMQKTTKTGPSALERYGKPILSGAGDIVKAIGSPFYSVFDAENALMDTGADVMGIPRQGHTYSSEKFDTAVDSIFGQGDPTISAINQGVVSSLLFGGIAKTGAGLAKSAAMGAASGLAAEKTSEVLGPTAGVFAGMAPQAIVSVLSRVPGWKTRNAHKLIADAVKDTTPEEWLQAENLAKGSKASGVPLMGQEHLPAHSSVQDLASAVAASPHGEGKMQRFAANRIPAAFTAAGAAVKAAGGAPRDLQQAANVTQEAATDVAKVAEGAPGALTKPLYTIADTGKVPLQSLDHAFNMIQHSSGTATDSTRNLLSALQRDIANQGDSVKGLRNVLKEWRNKVNAEGVGAEVPKKTRQQVFTPILDELQNQLVTHSPTLEYANKMFATLKDAITNPVMRGPVGSVAEGGAKKDVPANVKKIIDEFSSDSPTASPARIRELGTYLQKVNPSAVPNVIQSYFALRLAQAAEDLQGRPNPRIGANLKNEIYGNEQQKKLTEAMLEVAAKSTGRDPNKVIEGFKRTMEVLESTGKTPGVGSPTHSRGEIKAQAEKTPMHIRAGAYLKDLVGRQSYGEIARVFTHPDSLKLLQEIAQTPKSSPKYNELIATLFSAERGAQIGQGRQPESEDR